MDIQIVENPRLDDFTHENVTASLSPLGDNRMSRIFRFITGFMFEAQEQGMVTDITLRMAYREAFAQYNVTLYRVGELNDTR